MVTDKKIDLTLAFLQTQPGAAASLLEQQPPEEVAEFLATVPPTHAAMVLEKMLPQHAAKICGRLPVEQCASIIRPLSTGMSAAVLRLIPVERQEQILVMLPEKSRITLRFVLNYPEDAVGAWMIPNGPTLPNDCLVKEALLRMADDQIEGEHELIPVVGRNGLLEGEVTLRALVSAAEDISIASLMRKADHRLLARSSLESESNNQGWRSRDVLPVVNRYGALVGVLRHTDLRHGLTRRSDLPDDLPETGILGQVFRAYLTCFVALANTLFEKEKN